MNKHLLILFLALTTFMSDGCHPNAGNHSVPTLDLLPRDIVEATGSKFFEQYDLDKKQNPCYLQADLDDNPEPDYVVFLINKKDYASIIAFIVNGRTVVKNIISFTGISSPLLYTKQVRHFPAGSGLSPKVKGLVMAFENNEVRWVYLYKDKWNAINPD
jgi:hypothetical protein